MPADTCVHHLAYHTGRGSAIFQRSDSFEYVYRETHRIGGTVWRAVATLRPNKKSESYVALQYHDPTTGTWPTFERLDHKFVEARCVLQGGPTFDEGEALGQAADLVGEVVQIAAAAYPDGVPTGVEKAGPDDLINYGTGLDLARLRGAFPDFPETFEG